VVPASGPETYFAGFGDDVDIRTSAAPDLSGDEREECTAKANALAAKHRSGNL
jgi:hypothetical protein